MQNQLSISELQVITHQNLPVVTTSLLANLFNTKDHIIRKNFARNKQRFVEGKHFFTLTGHDLRQFKSDVFNRESLRHSVISAKNVKALTVWTERGAARHAKMLETDKAWEVFEALEDNYFRREQPKPETQVNTLPATLNADSLKHLNALFFQLSGRQSVVVNENDLSSLVYCIRALDEQLKNLSTVIDALKKRAGNISLAVGYAGIN